ncbi:MAG: proline--tRNA ligase [Oscillochloris sp.]|nr:proline--tRNA ligase [Oscillochloris sp.]
MRLSSLLGRTLRDTPTEAEFVGHQLALRAGLARGIAPGSYALLPLGMAALRRIEAIIHEELARAGAQEFRTPVVQPAALWEASGRYQQYGPLMLRAADRAARPLVIAPTHEEAVADLARREVNSYRQLPALLYQVHTKYRDELRTKGGLMRLREFTMLDAYSLDADSAGLDRSYELLASAFERILARCGVAYVAVEASAGEMGGGEPREYMAISPSGEDLLALCAGCGYAANVEVATQKRRGAAATTPAAGASQDSCYAHSETADRGQETESPPIEEVATPRTATIADLAAFLGVPPAATAKAVFFDTPERGLLFAVIRGDLEVNEVKLCAAAGVSELRPASVDQIAAAGAVPGYASPVGLQVAEGTGPGVFVLADPSVAEGMGGFVAGANRAGYHLRNVVYGRDWRASRVADIALVRSGDPCPRCGAPLALERGVEIGHIFKLGDRYTRALGATYLAEDGATRPVVMGSYGIGLERLLQIIIEQHHDEAGIVWPASVAPAAVHLIALGKGEALRATAEELLAELEQAGLRVLYDDRGESAGVKFNDADLIGLPVRLVVSDRLLATGELELRPRGGATIKVARGELLRHLRELLAA